MWYIWCNQNSPVFGKDKMTTFERYFIDDKQNCRELYYNKDENGIVNIMTYLDDMEKKNVLKYLYV